jgi:hypothetical protein
MKLTPEIEDLISPDNIVALESVHGALPECMRKDFEELISNVVSDAFDAGILEEL